MEGMRLRIKDVDFDRQVIIVRDAKGGKDRVVMLPRSLVAALRLQLQVARALWEADRRAQRGGVETPHALEQKYPKVGYGDTEGVVRRLRDPMCARLGRIFDLERQIGEPGQTRVEQLRSVEGLVEDLGQLDKLLSRHLAQYTGKNHDFKVWMDQKITEVRLTFQDWDRALSRIRAQ